MKVINLNQLDMNNPKQNLIVISNSIVESRYNLSMPTQKLLLFLISKITYEERKQGLFLNVLTFTFDELKDFFQIAGRINDKNLLGHLRDVIKELDTNTIEIKEVVKNNKTIWKSYPWRSESTWDESRSIFTFKFNQALAPILLQLKSYFSSNLIEYLKLNSKHSIKLYHLFRANDFMRNQLSFDLDELKQKLGIENLYERWDVFKDKVLDSSINELNKETNYFFEYKTERIGRSIGRVIIYSFEKSDDKACTRFVRKSIDNFLKTNKTKGSTREIFNSLSFSFNKQNETLYIRFKDKQSLDSFLTSNPSTRTEKQAYQLIDKGFSSYGIDKLLKSLFREQTRYEYSSVNYIKKEPSKQLKNKIEKEEEPYLNMAELEKLEKLANQGSEISNEDLKPIKGFGLTTSQAEKIFLIEGNKKIKERVLELLKNGVSKLDIPNELIKEYQKEKIL